MEAENPVVNTESTELTSPSEAPPITRWVSPATDVLHTPHGLRLVADIPGVAPENVDLDLDGRQLTISAARGGGVGYRRVFRLDDQIERDGIVAAVKHGVLTMDLPKRADLRRRSIPVS